jgi:hypothetical protein
VQIFPFFDHRPPVAAWARGLRSIFPGKKPEEESSSLFRLRAAHFGKALLARLANIEISHQSIFSAISEESVSLK